MMMRNRPRIKPRMHEWLMAKVNELRGLQSAGGDASRLRPFFGRTLMASILDKAFKGGL